MARCTVSKPNDVIGGGGRGRRGGGRGGCGSGWIVGSSSRSTSGGIGSGRLYGLWYGGATTLPDSTHLPRCSSSDGLTSPTCLLAVIRCGRLTALLVCVVVQVELAYAASLCLPSLAIADWLEQLHIILRYPSHLSSHPTVIVRLHVPRLPLLLLLLLLLLPLTASTAAERD